MDTLKKILAMVALTLAVGGAIIGLVAVIKTRIVPAIIGDCILLTLAFPSVVKLFNYIKR